MASFTLKIARVARERRGPIRFGGQNYDFPEDSFSRSRLKQLKKQFAAFSPKLDKEDDSSCVFEHATPALAAELERFQRRMKLTFEYLVEEKYTDDDYAGAKYGWLGIDGEPIDCNQDYEPLNEYKPVL